MDIKKLQRVIVDGLEDVKGQNIVVFDTEHLSSLFERVIIASGTSNRQTKSLAASVRDAVKQAGYPVPRVEGEVNGEWIIVDCGAAVVHLMQPNIREYYHLEEIWGEKPVKLKLDSAPKRLVKAEEVAAVAPAKKKAPARKAAASSAPAESAPAKKAPTRKAPAASAVERDAKAPAAKRRATAAKAAAPAKRAAPAKAGVTRTVGVKTSTAAAKKAPARKAPSSPAPRVARKAPVKTIAVNKPTTKKAATARAASSAAAPKRPSASKPAAKKAPRGA